MTEQRGADARSPERTALPRLHSGIVKKDAEELQVVDESWDTLEPNPSEVPTLPPPAVVLVEKDGDLQVYHRLLRVRPKSVAEPPPSAPQGVTIEEVVADLRRDPRSEE